MRKHADTPEETAKRCAEIGAFSSAYRIAEFPTDAPPELIDSEVLALLANRAVDQPTINESRACYRLFYVGSGGAISLESNHEKTQGKAANERSRIERQDNNRSWQT